MDIGQKMWPLWSVNRSVQCKCELPLRISSITETQRYPVGDGGSGTCSQHCCLVTPGSIHARLVAETEVLLPCRVQTGKRLLLFSFEGDSWLMRSRGLEATALCYYKWRAVRGEQEAWNSFLSCLKVGKRFVSMQYCPHCSTPFYIYVGTISSTFRLLTGRVCLNCNRNEK